jgi:hypothetical protein
MKILEKFYKINTKYNLLSGNFFFLIATCLLSLNLLRPFGLAISDWLYFLSLFCVVLLTFIVKPRIYQHWFHNRFLWFAILFLAGAGISLTRSKYPVIAIVEIIQQLYVMTFFVSLCQWMVGNGKLSVVINAFIFAGVISACVALIDYSTGARLGPILSATPNSDLNYRFAGTLGHPNKFGYFMVLTSLMTLGKWNARHLSLIKRVGLGMILFAQGFGLYLSGSVTAYIGFLISSAVIVLFSRDKRKVLLGITIMIVTPLALVLSGNSNIISVSLNRVQTDTAESRWQIFMQAINDIIRSPLVGVGSDQISTSGIRASERYLEYSVHNVLLQIWYTSGLFAFIAWAGIYLSLGWNSLRMLWLEYKEDSSPTIVALASAVLAILVMDQFQDGIYQREKWLIFGLFIGYIWISKAELHSVR